MKKSTVCIAIELFTGKRLAPLPETFRILNNPFMTPRIIPLPHQEAFGEIESSMCVSYFQPPAFMDIQRCMYLDHYSKVRQ